MAEGRLRPLDGLRGLAVTQVFLFHLAGGAHAQWWPLRLFGLVNQQGWTGVSLFYVLSGFLITGILWDARDQAHGLRNFFVRRALRIAPLYYSALALVLVAAAAAHSLPAAAHRIVWPALFLEDIPGAPMDAINHTASPFLLYHFTSLAVEEQFYLVWPFVVKLVKDARTMRWICVGVFLLGWIFRLWVAVQTPHPEAWINFSGSRAGEFAVGGWLAMTAKEKWQNAHWKCVAWMALLGSIIGFVLLESTASNMGTLEQVVLAVGLGLVAFAAGASLVLALTEPRISAVLSLKPLVWLGGISYGVYVYHLLLWPLYDAPARWLTGSATSAPYLVVRFALAVAITLSAAIASYRWLERPFLRLKQRFSAPSLAVATGQGDARY